MEAIDTADRLRLVVPEEATGRVAEIFDDIRKTRGDNGLTSTWRFFAHDPVLLEHWWGLVRHLESGVGWVEPELLHAIALVCATDVGCSRCINNHQSQLIDDCGLSHEDVAKILDFEASDELPLRWRTTLGFAKKIADGTELDPADIRAMRALGCEDRDLVEITSVALIESALAKRSLAASVFDDLTP